jgi:hypothetical protein
MQQKSVLSVFSFSAVSFAPKFYVVLVFLTFPLVFGEKKAELGRKNFILAR